MSDRHAILLLRIILGARVLLGVVFFIPGVIGLLNLAPLPTTTPAAAQFVEAMVASGYLSQALSVFEIVCGLALIAGFFVPLALVLLAPIIVNIMLYLVFLDHAGLPIGIGVVLLELFLVFFHRSAYLGLMQAQAELS
jgi:uncharacterized membrane protein YphA (DoxX/SURF4 family)